MITRYDTMMDTYAANMVTWCEALHLKTRIAYGPKVTNNMAYGLRMSEGLQPQTVFRQGRLVVKFTVMFCQTNNCFTQRSHFKFIYESCDTGDSGYKQNYSSV